MCSHLLERLPELFRNLLDSKLLQPHNYKESPTFPKLSNVSKLLAIPYLLAKVKDFEAKIAESIEKTVRNLKKRTEIQEETRTGQTMSKKEQIGKPLKKRRKQKQYITRN